MNNYIKHKLIKFLGILVILILILSVSLGFLYKDNYFKDINKRCRVLVSNQLNSILNNDKNNNSIQQ